MTIPQNAFKRVLRERRPQIGLWSSFPSNNTVEVLAGAGVGPGDRSSGPVPSLLAPCDLQAMSR